MTDRFCTPMKAYLLPSFDNFFRTKTSTSFANVEATLHKNRVLQEGEKFSGYTVGDECKDGSIIFSRRVDW